MDEVVLARHGETETTHRRVVGGDAGLTEAGRAQARALGAELASFPLEVCLTSEARRARETAELALGGRDVRVEVLPDLADIDFGQFAGGLLEDYRAWVAAHDPAEAPPGGESRVATLRRFARAFDAIAVRPERRVLVVAHGLLLRAAMDARPQAEVAGVAYGSFVRLPREELEQAARRLARWCQAPSW
jgi:broad specificity phosphatase PhoE